MLNRHVHDVFLIMFYQQKMVCINKHGDYHGFINKNADDTTMSMDVEDISDKLVNSAAVYDDRWWVYIVGGSDPPP